MKENLEIISLAIGILASVLTGLWFIWNKRKSSIHENYNTLARTWSNEGCVGSTESMFINLNLRLSNGELFGSVSSPEIERDYDVYVTVGWFSSLLTIGESFGRGTFVKATVKVKITGNRNRLEWTPIKVPPQYKLPTKTILWPSDVESFKTV